MEVDIPFIQTLLKVNGLGADTNTLEVTTVLKKAGYSDDDIAEVIRSLHIKPYSPPEVGSLLYMPEVVVEAPLYKRLPTLMIKGMVRWLGKIGIHINLDMLKAKKK